MTEPEDLRWFLDLVPRLSFTFAKTYANSAPHSYIVAGRTPGITRADFERAAGVIEVFGQPKLFHSYVNLYLDHPRLGVHYWHMDPDVGSADLINMADRHLLYGRQTLPSTANGSFVDADRIAPYWREIMRDEANDARVLAEVRARFPEGTAPLVLDLNGDGWALDAGITSPGRCWVVNASQGVLNQIVKRHPTIGRVTSAHPDTVPLGLIPGHFDLLLAPSAPWALSLESLARFSSLADAVVLI